VTEREEEIKGRMQSIRSAARAANHERLAHAVKDAEAHAIEDVSYLIGRVEYLYEVLERRVAA